MGKISTKNKNGFLVFIIVLMISIITSCDFTQSSQDLLAEFPMKDPQKTITSTPTITSKPSLTRWPTKTPSITATPTPYNFGWPIMEQEDYTITKQNSFYHFLKYGYLPLLLHYDTQLLLDYSDKKLNENLNHFLRNLYPKFKFYPHEMENGELGVVKDYTGSGTDFLNYDWDYEFDRSTAAELCQFFEAATLEGYGLAKEPGESVFSAFIVLISEFGDSGNIDDPFLFYCSNLDRESENFLLIAKAQGEDELVQSLFDANLENLYNKPISRIYPTHIVQTITPIPPTVTTTRENTLKPFPTNTLLATRTPSFTPVPIHLGEGYSEYGWPLLMDMPEEITVNKNHSMHVLKPAISKYIDTFDTTLLFAYQKGKLSENLTLFLSKLFTSSFNFTNCVSGAICWQTPPGVNLLDGDLSEYVIEEASSSELCQFMEAGTLEGYGYVKVEKYGSVKSALTYLSKRFGNPDYIEDSYKFYCSNFDPDSEDFLSIAKLLGYWDLISEIEDEVKP